MSRLAVAVRFDLRTGQFRQPFKPPIGPHLQAFAIFAMIMAAKGAVVSRGDLTAEMARGRRPETLPDLERELWREVAYLRGWLAGTDLDIRKGPGGYRRAPFVEIIDRRGDPMWVGHGNRYWRHRAA